MWYFPTSTGGMFMQTIKAVVLILFWFSPLGMWLAGFLEKQAQKKLEQQWREIKSAPD